MALPRTGPGPGLRLASLNVQSRDFRDVVPFLVQFGLYVSPVGFSSSIVPAKAMTGVSQFRRMEKRFAGVI